MNNMKLKQVYFKVQQNFIRNSAVNSVPTSDTTNSAELKPFEEIPGPSSLPIIGQMHHFLPGNILSDPATMRDKLFEHFGPIVKLNGILGGNSVLFLYDPEPFATVLRSEDRYPFRNAFSALEYYRKDHKKRMGQDVPKWTGLITDHNETWRKFRFTVNPIMLQPKTIKLYASVLEDVADDMITRMKSLLDENNMIKNTFNTEMNLWALESIAAVTLGRRLNCFDPNLAEDSPERKLIRVVHEMIDISAILDLQRFLWKYISTPVFRKGMKLYEEQENLTKYFVHKAMEDFKNKSKPDEEKAILEKLLEIDEEVAVIMASDSLFAGVDTVGNTMAITLYLLASNPHKQDKLREELRSGTERKYLKACLKESQRMIPVAGANIRRLSKEHNLLGYRVPRGVDVIFCHETLCNMDKYFPRSKEYIPERWIDKDSPLYYTSAPPFVYNPFGFGVRSCIGRRIAELEMETFLSKVIEKFEITWHGPPMKTDHIFLHYVKPPFYFVFKEL